MQHPDEGTIHGWLDGALTPEETSAIEAHVASCAECAAVVAEARGIRAAATRILSALDDVPAGVIPTPDYFADVRAAEAADAANRRSRRALWRRPGMRAAAALIAVAGLSWAVLRDGNEARDENAPAVISPALRNDSAVVEASVPDTTRLATILPKAGTEVRPATPRAARSRPQPVAPQSPANRAQDVQAEAVTERDARQLAALEERRRENVELRAESKVTATTPAAPQTAASGAGAVAGALSQAPTAAAPAPAEPLPPRIVIDRAFVDSVLAADSLETADVYSATGRVPLAARSASPQLDRGRESGARLSANPTMLRAQGCWLLETSAWSPRYRATDTLRLLPRRIELMLDRGIADEAGERLVRPAPGDPTLPIGATGIWRVIATNQVRLTIATRDRWTTVTLTVGDDSLSGTARAYSEVDRLLRRATVSARRVVCRTEP